MQDLHAVDAALDAGYYQAHFEALPLVVLAIGAVVFVQWTLKRR